MAGKKDVTAYKRPHKLKYGKWGLIFILPFFICYGVFQLYPLIATFYRSFFHDKTDIFLNSVFAVSYTHLDVYKRQLPISLFPFFVNG